MAAKTQNHHSPFSRISRLIRSGPSSPLAREPDADPPAQEDWYIPYSGPYEPPRGMPESGVERDSWGNLVSGWLAQDPLARAEDRYARMNRDRAHSDAPALTSSGRVVPTTRNRAFSATRSMPRPNVNSIIHLDQAGGVGEAPVPMREPQEAPPPKHETTRHSLASILTLGTRRGLSVRHSSSAGQLSRKTSGSTDHHYPPPQTENVPLPRRHPYAFPYSTTATTSTPPRIPTPPPAPSSPISPVRRSPSKRRVTPKPSHTHPPPAFLQPTPRDRLGIRGSISTPNLRHPPSHAQLRAGAGSAAPPPTSVPKGKHRWLSPETWCDALILPRPRFAIRVDPGGSSGRIVSPPGSPVLPNTITYYQSRAVREPTTAQESRARASPPGQPVAGPSRITVEREAAEVRRSSGDRHERGISMAPTSFKPPRPKSFALDDLALPSPVPSLTKVLEEGRQLEADRKAWQSQATHSFQNKRARSVSRARAKTLSAAAHAQPPARESAFGVLAERTLLGNQSRPPTVHIRLRQSKSQSQGLRTEDEGTGTYASGVGVGTSTSHSHGRTRSHAHSNSVGTATSSQGRTEESFMWGGSGTGHGRGHHQRSNSLSKSALRLVRHTASSAAGFCGFASAERVFEGGREKVGTPAEEKADAFESAMRRQDTRVLRLQDQVRREEHGHHENVVVVTPPEHGGAQTVVAGPGGLHGLSPAPSSAKSSSGEVGIAISTPTPSDELAKQQYEGRERLRLPAHPYAQGATFPVRSSSSERDRSASHPSEPQRDEVSRKESLERHRQPVLVHPYAPFSKTSHPYASVPAVWAKSEPHQTPVQPVVSVDAATDEDGQEVEIPADATSSMYAELTPGHIREIRPEQLRYSPFIMVHPVEQKKRPKADTLGPPAGSHPYGPQSKRMSEWGFADALTETLRGRGSVDSGLGTSESLEHLRDAAAPAGAPPPEDSELRPVPIEDPSARLHLRMSRRETARSSSNHTLASSPMEFMNPPSFRLQPTGDRLTANGHSSGSSPGVISHDSSPPLSPRSLSANDDLERFRDLFYQPPPRALTPEDGSDVGFRRSAPSRQSSSVSTRSVSGLTTLTRQLAEDFEDSMDEIEESPMYGRRIGGLRGLRPQNASPDPSQVLSGLSSGTSTPPEASSPPLRFTLDQTISLAQPTINVPEDVAESSRASSILEYSPQESSDAGHMRVGSIDALTTPAAVSSPRRSSTRLSFVHYLRENQEQEEDHGGQDIPVPRVHSGYSSLGPISSNARSSFITSGTEASRMSGLSDFPVPPTDFPADQLSVLDSYFDYSRHSQQDNGFLSPSRPGILVREASTTTFGGQSEIGQAL